MAIELDHFIVPTRNKIASAKLLAELLGVSWSESGIGPFSPVYINNGLTLDFIETDEPFPVHHYCFRVGQTEFNSILERIEGAGIKFRSTVRGPVDMQVGTEFGNIYWISADVTRCSSSRLSFVAPR